MKTHRTKDKCNVIPYSAYILWV